MKSGSAVKTADKKNQKNADAASSSSSSSTYTYEYEYQYVYPKLSSLLTHKSMIGARYEREFWTDELLKKLYYYIPNDRYWGKFDLDNLDESIKLNKLKRPIEDYLIVPKKFEYMCDEFSDLVATGATTTTGVTTSTTKTVATTTENVSTTTSNTEYIIERLKNDLEMKKKFLQCIGSYPDKKLRKHFYKLLKWRKENVEDDDNREYFKQILKNTIKKCRRKIKKKRGERKEVDDEDTNKIVERLEVKGTETIEFGNSSKYNERKHDKSDKKKKSRFVKMEFDKEMRDQLKRDVRSKSTLDKDEALSRKSNIKSQLRNSPLLDRKNKSIEEQKSSGKAKTETSSVKTQRTAIGKASPKRKDIKLSASKSGTSKKSGSIIRSRGSGTVEKIEDLKRKMEELNYSSTTKTGAAYKVDTMAQFTVNDENINYLTVTDGSASEKHGEPKSLLRETVKKVITEMTLNYEKLSSLSEAGSSIKGNFLGIKPELDLITEETIQRQTEAKNKIITILRTLKGIRKNIRQNRLETKKYEASLKINQKMMENLRKTKVLNWFKQKDYLKQMKIKKEEMCLFDKTDHVNLLKRILSENKTIGSFLEHRWDIVTYLADTSKDESAESSKKASIPYESGTSDDEVKPKVINEVKKERESRASRASSTMKSSPKESVRSRSSRASSVVRKSAIERRETIVYEISEPDDFRDLDDWEEFMEKVVKETKAMKAEDKKAGIGVINREDILYVLRPESKRTSLPDFIYEMFETGLIPDEEEIAEGVTFFKKKAEAALSEEKFEEVCALERVESDFVVRRVIDKRIEKLFANFDRTRIEYTKDTLEEYRYDKCPIQWQVTQRRIQQQKLIQECEQRSRSFRTIPLSGSSKDDEPCYIMDLKLTVGLKLKKAITEVLMVRPAEKPIEYLVGMLHHYSYDEEYEKNMNALDREILLKYDDLHVHKNYVPRRFKTIADVIMESDSPYPTDSETSFDSELLEDRNVYDIIEECRKPKPYDLSFLFADMISSESMPTSPSNISIASLLTVTSGMTVGSSIATMSIEEPSDLEICDDFEVPKLLKYPPGYAMDPNDPPPFEIVDGRVVFIAVREIKFATPLMDLYEPPPFDMGFDDILLNEVNNVDELIEIDLDELIPIDKNADRTCHPSYLQRYKGPCQSHTPPCGWPRGYAMNPNDPPPFNMGYADILLNNVNNRDKPIEIGLEELLDIAAVVKRIEAILAGEYSVTRKTVTADDAA